MYKDSGYTIISFKQSSLSLPALQEHQKQTLLGRNRRIKTPYLLSILLRNSRSTTAYSKRPLPLLPITLHSQPYKATQILIQTRIPIAIPITIPITIPILILIQIQNGIRNIYAASYIDLITTTTLIRRNVLKDRNQTQTSRRKQKKRSRLHPRLNVSLIIYKKEDRKQRRTQNLQLILILKPHLLRHLLAILPRLVLAKFHSNSRTPRYLTLVQIPTSIITKKTLPSFTQLQKTTT